jgi:hypothetical protein
VSQDDLDKVRRTSRPVLFDTGLPDAPFAIKGSSFFVGYGRSVFVASARHVIRDFPAHKLIFYPTESSKYPVRVVSSWRVVDSANNADSSDLFLAKVDFTHLPRRVRARARIIHLDPPEATLWFDERHTSTFFLVGYPSERNAANYELSQVLIAQVLVQGRYDGPAEAQGVHQLRLQNPLGLDFDGLSGSPVFSMRHEVAAPAPLRFCGLAIRGSGASGLVRFLGSDVVRLALREATEQSDAPNSAPNWGHIPK